MEQNAYLVMPVSGGHGVGAVDPSFPRTRQILDALAGSAAAAAPRETTIQSEIRIFPFEVLSPDQRVAVTMNPSTPFLAAEMPHCFLLRSLLIPGYRIRASHDTTQAARSARNTSRSTKY